MDNYSFTRQRSLWDLKRADALDLKQARRIAFRGVLRPEDISEENPGRDSVVVVRIVRGEEATAIPVLDEPVRGLRIGRIVEAGRDHDRILAAVIRGDLCRGAGHTVGGHKTTLERGIQRIKWRLILPKGLDAERARDEVVEIRLIVPAEVDWHRREEVVGGAKVAALAVGQPHFVVGKMHAGKTSAKGQASVAGPVSRAKICTNRTLGPVVIEDVLAGEHAAFTGDEKAGHAASKIDPHAAGSGNDAAPDRARAGRRHARIAQPRVRELRVLYRLALAEERNMAVECAQAEAAGHIANQKFVGRIADGQPAVLRCQLKLAANSIGKLLRGRIRGVGWKRAEVRNVAGAEAGGVEQAGVQKHRQRNRGEPLRLPDHGRRLSRSLDIIEAV